MNISSITNFNEIDSVILSKVLGSRHADLLRTIRKIQINVGDEQSRSLWKSTSYSTKQGIIKENYQLTKKGLLLIVSKYDDNLRLQIINRMEHLEFENIRLLKVQNERLWDKEDRLDLIPKWGR